MDPHPNLTPAVIRGLGWLYLTLFAMNAVWTGRKLKRHESLTSIGAWALYTALLGMIGIAHVTGGSSPQNFLVAMPGWAKERIDMLAGPVIYFSLSIGLFLVVLWQRKALVKPTVAWVILNGVVLLMALSMTDYDFRQIVGKPDNVPIVSMLFIVGYFTWLFLRRAVDNDERVAAGRPLFEQEENEKVLVWPDLVYTEMICMIALTAILVIWGVLLQAPLEEPASAVKTPNPSKAPWYFLGLQEMLVYYDPWMAGVVLPSVIVVGLMALPYIDFNKKGNGYYTFNERKFSIMTFMFGFLPLWLGLIILGTFLRGPNWNFFGIYEFWDVHKLEVLNNVNLSEYFWVDFLGKPLPSNILLRELPGLALVFVYMFAPPALMAMTFFRGFFAKMGFMRYMVLANLILLMSCLPIKMVLRWVFKLKYIVAIPEWFFNI
jgi:Cytochrome b(C-terminal)/b6/petD